MEDYEEQESSPRSTQLDFSGRLSGDDSASHFRADKAVKLRLVSLMGLLLLVIVAMKEAGKPERWMWLGFDPPADAALVSEEEISGDDIVLKAESLASQSNPQAQLDQGVGYMPDRIANRLKQTDEGPANRSDRSDQSDPDSMGASREENEDPQQTPVAIDFWRTAFVKLTNVQQEAFYQLLRRIDTARLQPPQAELPFEDTVARLAKLQLNHQTRILGEMAAMSKGEPKNELSENLFAFDQSWQKHGLPALKASIAGADFTMTDQATIRSIRATIDPIVLKDVQDMTGMGNPRDRLAWLAIWDFVQRDAETVHRRHQPETTLLQLIGQPQAFRGQTITVSGTVRTIRRKDLKQTQLNLDHYFELWIEPPGRTIDGLICVYAATLPQGFDSVVPELTAQYQKVQFSATVAGRFFKIRSYQDAGKSVSHCPVVVAETFVADFDASPSQSTSAAPSWQPSAPLALTFLLVAALAAVGIALAVFRSTHWGTQRADKPTSQRVSRSLDALVDDETVMTDAQRVAELNKRLEEDFS